MKNTFAVSMTLLLVFTLIGSIFAYKKATTPHHAESHAEAAATPATTTPATTTAEPPATGEATSAGAATGNTPDQTAAAAAASTPAGDADAGKTKFAATCAGCHGSKAEGGVGPALNVTKDWTDEQFSLAVREGKAPTKTLSAVMPHFTAPQVSDDEVVNIHAYLKTLN